MAQLALNAAVRVGTAFVAGVADRAISNLFAPDVEGPRLSELTVQTSTEGAPVPIVYGRMRVSGQVIWAARFTEHADTTSAGGKGGGPDVTEYRYTASFAVALCEGPIAQIGRVWANGEEMDLSRTALRVYAGDEVQDPDPLIESVEGVGKAPAYRGTAYVVFEDLPLEAYGNRLPNLAFEVIAPPESEGPTLERLVKGVCLIPGSGEFAYADEPVMRELAAGAEAAENVHTARAASDLEAALDDLEARLPECSSVALVTSWFGDDLRCGDCAIQPKVEGADRETRPLEWRVAWLDRGAALIVSQDANGPVYGGTPSDETIVAAIKALKARGHAVTLYPFILMDVPVGNGLADPYGGVEQAAFPWRGRITCDPAPGAPGSPDKTAAAGEQIDAFFGTASAADFSVAGETVSYAGPDEWSFRRFILHHAALAAAAGGVEAFLIGSEMRGLTTVRDGAASYPAVGALKSLAAEARALLGPATQLSYAADWSEYSGHDPVDGSGDRIFHLDPLWSDAEIDFIGIDWYAPLADWRDGDAHLDALAGAASVHDRDYLSSNVEGGEGYDWFYAGPAARDAQTRTPITDGAHGEDWVFRFKDLRNWWANVHHDRIGGVRQPTPTAWTPMSKPVRFVEYGCPAVDKGANQPNVFIDPKSDESAAPYYSNRARDDLIQRRWIEALLDWWDDAHGRNPVSPVYGAPMIDLDHSQAWSWDARPFPAFPGLDDVWSDAPNWTTGHWLTGRAGQSGLGRIVADICARVGIGTVDVSALDGVLAGFVIDRTGSARSILEALGAVFGFSLVDRADGPVAVSATVDGATALSADALARPQDAPPLVFSRIGGAERPAEARLAHIADDGSYRPASAYGRGVDAERERLIDLSLPVLADSDLAASWARGVLARAVAAVDGAEATLPPSSARLEPGDAVTLDAGPTGRTWSIAALDGLAARTVAFTVAAPAPVSLAGPAPEAGEPAPVYPRPVIHLLDLPLGPGEGEARGGLWAAAAAEPWPGEIVIHAGVDAASTTERARITRRAAMGVLTQPLSPGFEGRWDRANAISLQLDSGALSSAERLSVLAGANRIAVAGSSGWEVVQFRSAELVAPDTWRLTGLLRGLGGSPADGAPVGAAVVLLDGAGATLPVAEHERDVALGVIAAPAGRGVDDIAARTATAAYEAVDLKPLSPVHLRVRSNADGLSLSWIRRTRIGGDAWTAGRVPLGEAREAYRVELLDAGGGVISERETETPALDLSDAELSALYPGGLDGARWRVAQISDAVGPGAAAEAPLTAG